MRYDPIGVIVGLLIVVFVLWLLFGYLPTR